jgi:hypothetical protein
MTLRQCASVASRAPLPSYTTGGRSAKLNAGKESVRRLHKSFLRAM